jgi:hypothetical protein
VFLEHFNKDTNVKMEKILRNTFVDIDIRMSNIEFDGYHFFYFFLFYFQSGATAAVIIIKREKEKRVIYSANCGDARSVLVLYNHFFL